MLASVPQKKEREGGGDRTGNRTTLDQQDGEYIDSSVGQTVMNCGRPAFSLMSAETVDLTDCGSVQSSRDACDITASSVMYLGLALSLNVLARSVSGSYADGVHGRVTQCVRNTGGRGDLACTVEVDRHSLALAHSERNYGGNGAVAAVLSRVNSVRALSEREFADKSERQSDQKSEGKKRVQEMSLRNESSSESESSEEEDSEKDSSKTACSDDDSFMVGIDSCEDSNSDNDSSEDSYYDFKSAYTDVQRKCKAAKLRHEAEMESLTEDFNEQQAEVDKLRNEQFELVTRSTMVKKSKWPAINRELQVVQAAMGDGKKSLQYLTDCKRKSMEKYSRRVEELDTRKREIDEARAERRSERAFQEEDLGIDSTANRRVQLSEQNTGQIRQTVKTERLSSPILLLLNGRLRALLW